MDPYSHMCKHPPPRIDQRYLAFGGSLTGGSTVVITGDTTYVRQPHFQGLSITFSDRQASMCEN